MACRINRGRFNTMAQEEGHQAGLEVVMIEDGPAPGVFNLAEISEYADSGRLVKRAVLFRKPIQSLVDEPEQARPIIRNLLRWAKEHGAK